jgi:hypothetical protein
MKNLIITLMLAGLFPVIASAQIPGALITEKKGAVPQSSDHVDTAVSPCGTSFAEGYALESNNVEPQGYDTLRAFLENCPLYPNSWQAFSMVGGAVSGWSAGGTGRWPDFLTWLKKVPYYNPDTNWYCNDVIDMLTAVQSNEAAQMAICQYIIQSGKCQQLVGSFEDSYNSSTHWRHQLWLDSIEQYYNYLGWTYSHHDSIVKVNPLGHQLILDSINADTLANPYDSTIPSLFALDLQALLGPQYAGVQQSQPITSQALMSAQLLENPMTDEIDIAFEMGRSALVTMQLSDLLGRNIPIANAKYQLEQAGQHDASIPAPNLPPGTYYLRITTDVGDAITLKVVKE